MAGPGQAEVVEGLYIPSFIQHLERAGQPGYPIIEARCGVCLFNDLDISTKVGDLIRAECSLPSDQQAKTKAEFYEKHSLERTVVLPCGHLTGRDCREAQAEHPDMSARMCNYCKTDTKCAGCPRILAEGTFDPVPWPLDPAKFQPYREFQAKVGLTPKENDPDVPRFCHRCAEWQVRRKFAEIYLTFPSCHAGNCYPPAPGGQILPVPPMENANHEMWRQRNVDPWLRRKVAEVALLVYPLAKGVREPALRAALEAEFLEERQKLAAYVLEQEFVRDAAQGAFRPCRQLDAANLPGRADLVLRAENMQRGFVMAELYAEEFGKRIQMRMPVAWYRGLEVPFERHLPEYQLEQGPNLDGATRRAVQLFLMTVGEDSVEAASERINILVEPTAAELVAWVKALYQAGGFSAHRTIQGVEWK
ncbi:hypothetical protein PG991_014775 [Apiospora marii]|uniref:Uncharacterized protein n=1 Tax=Apiospora marii TaxID=335849 RepID=A0ABR1R4J0_9PEZI